MYKIFTLGEILKDVHLRDLTPKEIKKVAPEELEKLRKSGKIISANDGGAPANLAAYTCLVGGIATMVTGVGNDCWGDELIKNFRKYGVDIKASRKDFTDVALVHVDKQGRHEFAKFLWDPCLMQTHQK